MLKVKNTLFIASFFLFQQAILCQPPIEELYAFNQHFTDTTYHLCPLHGTAAITWLKNLWNCGDKNHSTIKLLQQLFNVLENVELRSTTYDPYCKFTYTTIAALLNALEKENIDEKNGHGDFAILDKIKQTFKGKKNPKNLKTLIENIVGSIRESTEGIYPPRTAELVLLAFLSQKAVKTRELRNYVNVIKKQVDLPLYHEPTRTTKWTEEEFEQYISWCSAHQNEEQPDDIPYSFDSDIEFLLFCANLEHETTAAPPYLMYDYISVVNGKTVADCCESTLKYLSIILCYDIAAKKLDLARLPRNILENMPVAVRDHFNTCRVNGVKAINTRDLRETWYDLVSNIDRAEYRRKTSDDKNYEIHPSARNFIEIMYHIFGLQTPEVQVNADNVQNAWNELCKLLSTGSNFELSCINTFFQSDVVNTATFLLKENNNKKELKFTLHIKPEHTWISIDTQDNFQLFTIEHGIRKYTRKALFIQELLNEYNKSASLKLRDLLHFYAPYLEINQLPLNATCDTILFAHPTENDQQRLRLCKRMLSKIDDENSPLVVNVLNMLKTFDKPYFVGETLCNLLRKKVEVNKYVQAYLHENADILEEWSRTKIFMTLVQCKAWKTGNYKTLLTKMLDALPDYEKEFCLKVDTKATAILQLLLNHGHKNQDLQNTVVDTINKMEQSRSLKTLNRIRFSPFSLFNDEHSIQFRKELVECQTH